MRVMLLVALLVACAGCSTTVTPQPEKIDVPIYVPEAAPVHHTIHRLSREQTKALEDALAKAQKKLKQFDQEQGDPK